MSIFSGLFSSADKPKKVSDKKEVGVSAATVFGGYIQSDEKNPKLHDGNKQRNYEEMVRNHPIIAASHRVFLDTCSGAEWSSEPVDDSAEAKRYAELADSFMDGVETSWARVHKQAATYKYNGASILEWTAFINDEGYWAFKTIEPRRIRTISKWDLDDDGQLRGVEQTAPVSGETFYLPRWKLAVFTDDALSDQPDGMGLLRHVFRHAEKLESLEELELTAFERDVRGLMVGRIPYAELQKAVNNGDLTQEQAAALIKQFENFITMQRKKPNSALSMDSKTYENKSDTGINTSPVRQWDLEVIQGQQPGLSELDVAINRTNTEIARVFGTEFLLLGSDGAGSLALSQSKMSAFLESVNSTNKDIVDRAQKDLLDIAWRKNSLPEEYKPRWKVGDVQQTDLEKVAATMRDLFAAGIDSQDPMLNEVRGRMGFSPAPTIDLLDVEV